MQRMSGQYLFKLEAESSSSRLQAGSLWSLYALTVSPDLYVNYVNTITIVVASGVHQEVDDVSSVHVEPPFYLLSVWAAFRVGLVTSLQ